MKLNLGSGERMLKGYINVDYYYPADLKVDLSSFPWPWDDNSVEEIVAWDFLEHLKEFKTAWQEIHRILKPAGRVWIRVPHFRCPEAHWPEVHFHYFSIVTFQHLTKECWYAPNVKYKTISLRHWFGPKMKFLTPFANIWPLCWDWLGFPVSKVEWIGEKI